ncbi:MAG: radical SAM protein [Candidatus Omnitrophica bacterium]|nr:radical SAM protein [Candidatus Omnitrophota bacterium]
MAKNYQYIYGPVYSWRLGRSLGVDPLSAEDKNCNYDCVYCQLGKTVHFADERRVFVETGDIIKEIESFPEGGIDYITFSGRGEPTLAKNLGEMIRIIKETRDEKVAVITNSSLLHEADVRRDLSRADFVLAKLDACDQDSFATVNRARGDLNFEKIVQGIREFRRGFKGKLALQLMFVAFNQSLGEAMAAIAGDIDADEVEINTPLRPCAVKPLSEEELGAIKEYFKDLPVKTVFEQERKIIAPMDEDNTVKRHGIYKN